MNDKPKGRLIPKQKLEIVNAELDVPYSQGTKFLDRVQAVNLSLADNDPLAGKAVRHTIFNQSVKTFVRGKIHVLVDIEERDRPDTEYGPDRTIVQAYDEEGKPVSTKQGGGYRRSLEDDLALEAVKRRSIEGQHSITEVGLWLREPNWRGLDDDRKGRIVEKYWKAIEKGLDNYLDDPQKPAAPAPAPRQTAQDKRQAAEKPDKVSSQAATGAPVFKNFGEVLTRASKLKPSVSRAELLTALNLKEGQTPPDLNEAWSKAEELSLAKHEAAGGEANTAEEAWENLNRQ